MRMLVQRVQSAQCEVEGNTIGAIEQGLVVFVGFSKQDDHKLVERMAHRLVHARVFEDQKQKMNLDLQTIKGSILSISQFTLYGDTKKGHRPSFDQAAPALQAEQLYHHFNQELKKYVPVATGQFQANMTIHACMNGPVTLNYQEENS